MALRFIRFLKMQEEMGTLQRVLAALEIVSRALQQLVFFFSSRSPGILEDSQLLYKTGLALPTVVFAEKSLKRGILMGKS